MSNINEIDRRLLNLENQVKILLENLARNKKYTDYDIEAGRINTSKVQRATDENRENISEVNTSLADTQDALCEQSVVTDESVSDIENAMCESELANDDRLAAIEDALCELSMQ